MYDWLSLAEVQSGLAAAGSLGMLAFVLWRMNVARGGDGLALMEGFIWSLLAVPVFALVGVCVGRFAWILLTQRFPMLFGEEFESRSLHDE